MSETTQKFDLWCIVELFGHTKIAGRCTEQNVAGTNMLRVDVPETENQPAFTRLLGSAAINPVDEATAKAYAAALQVKPITAWDVKEMLKKNIEFAQLAISGRTESPNEDDLYEDLP